MISRDVRGMLRQAQADGYAIPAFNTINLEVTHAIVAMAEALKAPILLQIGRAAVDYAGLAPMLATVRSIAETASVPIGIHLDHCKNLKELQAAGGQGFTSLMYDGSQLSYDQNVENTAAAAAIAHAAGWPLEGELGHVAAANDPAAEKPPEDLTDPGFVEDFVARTQVDSLAIAIGTAHGRPRDSIQVDFDLLADIRRRLGVPLVLHGASGVTEKDLRRAVSLGIAKINFAAELSRTFAEGIRSACTEIEKNDTRALLGAARRQLEVKIRTIIEMTGAAGRAATVSGGARLTA